MAALRGGAAAEATVVRARDFDAALSVVLPSVSPRDEKAYAQMASKLRQSRGAQVQGVGGGGGTAAARSSSSTSAATGGDAGAPAVAPSS